MELASRRELEYSDDVHTDTRKLCVGWESCREVWLGRVEHVGNLPRHWYLAGVPARNGYNIRSSRLEEAERKGKWRYEWKN